MLLFCFFFVVFCCFFVCFFVVFFFFLKSLLYLMEYFNTVLKRPPMKLAGTNMPFCK